MYDRQTGSYWHQVSGEAIVGDLTGKALSLLPSVTASWEEWQGLYPQTRVLSRETGYRRDYSRDPFLGYALLVDRGDFFFPVSEKGRDPRLSPAEVVLAVEVGDSRRAYPLKALGDAALNDTLGGKRVVILSRKEGPSGAAYVPEIEGRELTFEIRNGDLVDRETGSLWDLAGLALTGPLAGSRLEPLPTRTTFWFALVASFPGIEVFDL